MPDSRWKLANFTADNDPPNVVRFFNKKFSDQILAVFARIKYTNGTKVYVWPIVGQYANEAWRLVYLGPL
ncbi:MAG: hypothetical protein Q9219_003314 [cf. Caloplaca sp. 3 TL-2023]